MKVTNELFNKCGIFKSYTCASILILITVYLIIPINCKKESKLNVPVINTTEVDSITLSSAICGGIVSYSDGSIVSARGICWSTDSIPSIDDDTTICGAGDGAYSGYMTNLATSTTYFVRAYATNSAGTGYGKIKTFTTNVKDADYNIYHAIHIIGQIWMGEDLKTTKYKNCLSIPLVTSANKWINLITPGYCWYNNDEGSKIKHGALYNWYTVNSGELCPAGWHAPSADEWELLIANLGGDEVAGGTLKDTGTVNWNSPNIGASNDVNFTAIPGGSRIYDGTFSLMGECSFWWTSTENSSTEAFCNSIQNNYSIIFTHPIYKYVGYSVRCIKDQ
jgi:uncharacterized protein (TIGR02145 family)